MKTLTVIGTVALAITSCLACRQVAPISASPFTGQYTVSSTPSSMEELQNPAPNSTQPDDMFYASMEVVFHASQAAQYPVTSTALQNALTTWAQALPIRLTIYVEDPRPPMPFFPRGAPSYLGRWNIVEILMSDLQAPPFNMNEGVLGVWLAGERRIVLDADLLETDAAMAYSVALHELGHMFGLPHLVGWGTPAPTGWLVVPTDKDAESYVMYPSRIAAKSQDSLSPLEIAVAKHYLLHMLGSMGASHTIQECDLTDGPWNSTMQKEESLR